MAHRRNRRPSRARLTATVVADPDLRWTAIDQVLASAPALKPLRARLTALLDQGRHPGTEGIGKVIEDIDEVGTELRAEMVDVVTVWAFAEGLRAGRRERRR